MNNCDRGRRTPRGYRLRLLLAFIIVVFASITTGASRAQSANEAAPLAQAVLFEEDPGNSAGRRIPGSVAWHTDTIKPAGGRDDIFVLADVDIPNRFKMTLTLKRNTDKALPASHVIELTFVPGPGFTGYQIDKVMGMLTKTAEQARGTPLAGVTIKVTDNVFMIGLSDLDADRQRNLQGLKERSWFDVAMVDGRKRRSILAFEKGASGQGAFIEALTAWGQN
jgi:hypothetical protein